MTRIIVLWGGMLAFAPLMGYGVPTEQEYIEQGRLMVCVLMDNEWHDLEELKEAGLRGDRFALWHATTPDGFFNFFATNEWTRTMCESAYNQYLTWVSTNDMSRLSNEENRTAQAAVEHAACMKYTNALEVVRACAHNPTMENRCDIIGAALSLGEVDDESYSLLESVVTNKMDFSYRDLKFLLWDYCDRLKAIDTNDMQAVSVRNKSARLFYARRLDWRCASRLDKLFLASFPGYDYSSNRLDHAMHVLSWATNEEWQSMRDYFTTVTNELISSGRELPPLEIAAP